MRPLVTALAALALASSAQAADAPAKPAAKPAAPAAAKPAPTKPGAGAPPLKIANFDARDPASIVALVAALGAKATITKNQDGQVFLTIATPGGDFGAQMIGCDDKGKACHAMAMFTAFERKGPTLAQINDFNRAQMSCRGILTPDGRPSVMYSTLLTLRATAEEMRQHMGVWQGCLNGFAEFARDPEAYLSRPHT